MQLELVLANELLGVYEFALQVVHKQARRGHQLVVLDLWINDYLLE